jgi:hypothetical protein
MLNSCPCFGFEAFTDRCDGGTHRSQQFGRILSVVELVGFLLHLARWSTFIFVEPSGLWEPSGCISLFLLQP